jgi:para-nitrobenzyl esterase
MYHGDAFAEHHGIVVVTLNYRLAEAGGLYLCHRAADFATSGNTALLDQIAALIWVREHIAAFGGDPNNVTLCGQSAGANAILALMAAPRAAGLFHRALCQSPSYMVRSKDDAINTTERFLQILEIKTITALQNMSLDALLAARGQLMRESAKPPSLSVWGAVLDDEVIPQHPWHAATAGTLAPIPLLIGVCHHDYRPYLRLLPTETLPQDEAAIMRLFDSLGVHGRCMLQVYRDRFGSITPAELLIEAMTDYRFRQPSIHLAQQHALHHPTFMYEFIWASPVQHGTLGSGHTVDIPFAWHTLWTPSTPYHLGDDPPTALADLMHEAWSTFARSGHPSAARLPMWPPYEPQQRATMALDTQPVLLVDPEQSRRCYWAEQSLLSCFSTSNSGFR